MIRARKLRAASDRRRKRDRCWHPGHSAATTKPYDPSTSSSTRRTLKRRSSLLHVGHAYSASSIGMASTMSPLTSPHRGQCAGRQGKPGGLTRPVASHPVRVALAASTARLGWDGKAMPHSSQNPTAPFSSTMLSCESPTTNSLSVCPSSGAPLASSDPHAITVASGPALLAGCAPKANHLGARRTMAPRCSFYRVGRRRRPGPQQPGPGATQHVRFATERRITSA